MIGILILMIAVSSDDPKFLVEGLGALRGSRSKGAEASEELAQDLLKRDLTSDQRARVHYEVAQNYAQSGLQEPQRLEFHVRQALPSLRDPELRLRLYVYWGDSISVDRQVDFSKRRRSSCQVYLKGLIEFMDMDLNVQEFDHPLAIPAINPHTRPEDIESYHKEFALRELARTNKRIRDIGPVIERQIAGLYRQQPYAIDELKAILTSTLSDTASVKRILRSVEQRMREKPGVQSDLGTTELSKGNGRRMWLIALNLFAVIVLVAVVLIRRRTGSVR